MKKINLILSIAFFIILFSCTEKIDVVVPIQDNQLVIEGRVTNLNDYFSVKISMTQPINGGNNFPKVSNAFVTISDNTGNTDTLYTIPNAPGEYYTLNKKKGIVGKIYSMKVIVNGITYTAQDILLPPPTLDSLYANYYTAGSSITMAYDGYYLFYDFNDPPNEKNYYRYDIIFDGYPMDIKEAGVFNDRFLAPKVIGAALPGVFSSGNNVELDLYSLTESGYNYYYGLSVQLSNTGGFFGTPPANPPTNISGGALGFFLVSSIAKDSLIVP